MKKKDKSKPVKENWIYVFCSTTKNNIYWYAEIYANNSGKYQLVNIKDNNIRKADKRDTLKKVQENVNLIYEEGGVQGENFFCLYGWRRFAKLSQWPSLTGDTSTAG